MTKKELIDSLKDFPDDMKVHIWCGFERRDPAGNYKIKRVFKSDNGMNCILIEPEDDFIFKMKKFREFYENIKKEDE